MADPLLRVFSAPAVRYFQEVARAGSFRKAAEQLNVAASAVHRHVGLLEEQIGTRLFDRSPGRGGLKLTAAGEVLAHRLQAAMGEVSTALREIEGLSGVQRGRVAIGTSDVLATDFMPSVLAEFKRAHPRVDVHVRVGSPSQMADQLLDHHLDALLCFDAAPRIGMSFVGEYALKSCVLVPRGHPFAEKRMLSLAECAEYPLILPDETQYLRGILDQMFHEVGVKPAPYIQTNSYTLMRDLVDDGLGIAIQTQLDGFSTRRHPNVVYVPLKESLARYSILTCCIANSRRLPIAANLFVEALQGALAGSFGKYRTDA
ncbi:MAG TPA: LysR family transcriptional regulator [Alphaproteobacteria bacterium]|jgi:DNA-binding transcriptional LysR family regulator|nr:LysR family transcriptional regulator [Alphaproteobacteria bacterium]